MNLNSPLTVTLHLASPKKVGNQRRVDFIIERLIKQRKRFYESIPLIMLTPALARRRGNHKTLKILKEDKNAFGVLVRRVINNRGAFKCPLNSIPLSIATSEKRKTKLTYEICKCFLQML